MNLPETLTFRKLQPDEQFERGDLFVEQEFPFDPSYNTLCEYVNEHELDKATTVEQALKMASVQDARFVSGLYRLVETPTPTQP